jgi:hypothetical protein
VPVQLGTIPIVLVLPILCLWCDSGMAALGREPNTYEGHKITFKGGKMAFKCVPVQFGTIPILHVFPISCLWCACGACGACAFYHRPFLGINVIS